MTYRATIRSSTDGEHLGPFEFQAPVLTSEIVTVPWEKDPDGVRIFQVEEIAHAAAGVLYPAFGDIGPHAILTGYEIT